MVSQLEVFPHQVQVEHKDMEIMWGRVYRLLQDMEVIWDKVFSHLQLVIFNPCQLVSWENREE